MNITDIRSSIVELSGSGKKVAPNARRHGIYSTFTIPGLDDMVGVRNTKQRFHDFAVPEDLNGRSMIDVGSNVGAMALEFARRGASVTGVEYRDDRVSLCNVMAQEFKLNAKFLQGDFNEILELDSDSRPAWIKKYDLVLCSSVDQYIEDLESFYEMLHDLCGHTLYLESNLQGKGLSDAENMLAILERAGFVRAEYIGNGHSGGISRKRKLYRAWIT